ncbi:MAG: hypothetical protein ABI348_04840 [Nitrososphaera sp.]
MKPSVTSRPRGVTIIAILNIISGIVMLFAGVGLAAVISLSTLDPGIAGQMAQTKLAGGVGVIVGGVLTVLGIISLVVAWGLLKGKGWAWTVTVILSIITVALGVVHLAGGNVVSIINIIISGVILYYVYRPHIKAYFGKVPPASSIA